MKRQSVVFGVGNKIVTGKGVSVPSNAEEEIAAGVMKNEKKIYGVTERGQTIKRPTEIATRESVKRGNWSNAEGAYCEKQIGVKPGIDKISETVNLIDHEIEYFCSMVM